MSKDDKITVTLDFPFEWTEGNIVSEIEIPRPKAHHMRGLNVKRLESETDEMFKLLQKLIGQPPKFIDRLDFQDFTKIMKVVEDFLQPGDSSDSEPKTDSTTA